MAATLNDLIAALDDPSGESTTTSLRQPVALRRALQIAVELGFADSANEGSNRALLDALNAFAQRRALDEHYAARPGPRPALHEVAHALAVIEDDPLADDPVLLRRAAGEVVRHRADADAYDVLLLATSLRAPKRQTPRRRSA
jgi:hypothetical protein